MGNTFKIEYNVDIVMCINATGSMGPYFDNVKNQALRFYRDLIAASEEKGKPIKELRGRVIVFRDYLANGHEAMLATDFFPLPEAERAFEKLLSGIKPIGGGDDRGDGLEALGFAIKSKWTTGGNKRRHIIIVWSDDATHPLGFGAAAPNYPRKMARDFDELSEWWGDAGQNGVMDNRAKRLLIFAPPKEYWSTIAESWDNVIHYESEAGRGLVGAEYEDIFGYLPCSSP